MAKAALNQQTRTIAKGFKESGNTLIFITLDPGYVATKLTDFKGTDDMDVSVKGMVNFVEQVEPSHSGLFFNYKGQQLEF